MSRYEGKIGGADDDSVDAAEILASLAKSGAGDSDRRRDAISKYLSASEGWREASAGLSGAFSAEGSLKAVKGA